MIVKPCVYISGPMSGHEDWNFPAFNDVANHLRSLGYPVINPADFGAKPEVEWAECIKRDLIAMFSCDRVITLDGWQRSRGATLEVHVARALGIPVVSYAQLVSGVTHAQ